MKTYIVLISLDKNGDARKQCEFIENLNISMPQPTESKIRNRIFSIIGDDDYNLSNIEVMSLTDFMDRVNDEEFNVDAYFMSYVNIYPFKSF